MLEEYSKRVLVTGFGPFPGVPENPTEALVRSLAAASPQAFGAAEFRAFVLPTDYRRSSAALRRVTKSLAPDLIVHFGLARGADRIRIERCAMRRIDPQHLDASGFAPRFGFARRAGPERLEATFPVERVVAALSAAGYPAEASEDAGAYVCNATFYRSLQAAGQGRVGFVHVPPEGTSGLTAARLRDAAELILRTANAQPEPDSPPPSVAAST